MRAERQALAHRNPAARLGLGCSLIISILIALTGIFLTLLYSNLSRDLPSLEALPSLLQAPEGVLLQPTRLYDRSGEHLLLTLQNPDAAGGQYLPLSLFSQSLISATLATKDPSFWQHSGFTLQGLFEGAHPTLAQGMVADLLLNNEPPGIRRALRERLLAAQITAKFGRDKVLEWYLNNINYGRLTYGADAAARAFFGKSAVELSLSEAALLAAVAEAPSLNPIDAPQASLERLQEVLQRMEQGGWVSPEATAQATQDKITFRTASPAAQNIAPAFTRLVLDQLKTQIPSARLERGGLRVITTLDYDLQIQTACALAVQLARLENPTDEAAINNDPSCQTARLLPALPSRAGLSTTTPGTDLQGNVLVLDPRNGQILALVGDVSREGDSTSLQGHPPGSLLSPWAYLTAFTRGLGPASLVWDLPIDQESPMGQINTRNFDGRYHGPMRLRLALANDYLVPVLKTIGQVGPANVISIAQQFGLAEIADSVSPDNSGLTDKLVLPWENSQVSLLDGSQAFGVFANGGTLAGRVLEKEGADGRLQPVGIQRVEDASGKVWLDWQAAQTRPVISAQLAYLITNVLSDETARWPSLGHPNALEVGRPAAAKIGQTTEGSDIWTVGYTPQRTVGVWIGLASESRGSEPSDTITGTLPITPTAALTITKSSALPVAGAAGIWNAVLQYASRDLPAADWLVPAGVVSIQVCDPSGLLPTPDCPTVVQEVSLENNEPAQVDNLYRSVQINRESGRLATIFTPPDLVEDRVFLVVPPEAASWAKESGYSVPPEEYDLITDPVVNPAAQITSPSMYGTVNGQVPIQGTAGGKQFKFYRVQVGQGLNPQAWLQIDQDSEQPVTDGQLAVWDTQGLNGLYTLQLQVGDEDKQIHTANLFVTVDNQSPRVHIDYPAEGQEFTRPGKLTLLASAEDEVGLHDVTFWIDGRLLKTLNQPPYAVIWQASPGKHILKVIATDLAKNASSDTINFVVK